MCGSYVIYYGRGRMIDVYMTYVRIQISYIVTDSFNYFPISKNLKLLDS